MVSLHLGAGHREHVGQLIQLDVSAPDWAAEEASWRQSDNCFFSSLLIRNPRAR